MKRALFACAAIAVVVALSPVAFAGTITVTDPSFETTPAGGYPFPCGTGCSYDYGQNETVPGWTASANSYAGQQQPGTQDSNFAEYNTLADGITFAYLNTAGTLSQTVGATVVNGDTYTLTVDVGCRNDLGCGIASGSYVDLVIGTGGTAIDVAATGSVLNQGGWVAWTANYTGTSLTAGNPITILLGNSSNAGNSQADFDNVQLSDSGVTSVPEGSSAMLYLLLAALVTLVGVRLSKPGMAV